MQLQTSTPTITAMDLRRGAGTFLDRVAYRGERFIVERAGKPKAVLVSVAEYEQMERLRQEAKANFFAMTDDIRTRVAQSGLSEQELEALIEQAITEVRRNQPVEKSISPSP
jgi:prevent-host-death family protein